MTDNTLILVGQLSVFVFIPILLTLIAYMGKRMLNTIDNLSREVAKLDKAVAILSENVKRLDRKVSP